jgi:hypothetical protein
VGKTFILIKQVAVTARAVTQSGKTSWVSKKTQVQAGYYKPSANSSALALSLVNMLKIFRVHCWMQYPYTAPSTLSPSLIRKTQGMCHRMQNYDIHLAFHQLIDAWNDMDDSQAVGLPEN